MGVLESHHRSEKGAKAERSLRRHRREGQFVRGLPGRALSEDVRRPHPPGAGLKRLFSRLTPGPSSAANPTRRWFSASKTSILPVEKVKTVIPVKPETCWQCGYPLEGADPRTQRHQVTEMPPIVAETVEYQRHTLTTPNPITSPAIHNDMPFSFSRSPRQSAAQRAGCTPWRGYSPHRYCTQHSWELKLNPIRQHLGDVQS